MLKFVLIWSVFSWTKVRNQTGRRSREQKVVLQFDAETCKSQNIISSVDFCDLLQAQVPIRLFDVFCSMLIPWMEFL